MKSLPSILGLALVIYGGYLMRVELSADREATHIKLIAAMIATGLVLVVPSQLAAGVKQVGTAVAEAWKARRADT